jgi:hypothetical protein
MNVEQMKIVVKEMIANTDLTPCVVGHRGVGKSAGIIQACRELERRYIPLRLGQMEVGDLVGIPFRTGELMHWSRPSWLPTEEEPPALIHCDELNRAQQEDTLQAIFQFVEPPAEGMQRAIHMHRLARRHKVVVSINPPDGSYQVATLDRALIDRMVMLFVETDYHCWARYALKRELAGDVRQFLAGNSGMLAKQGMPMEMHVEPSERGWEMVSVLKKCCKFPTELEMEVYAGIVGKEAAIMFMRWLSDRKGRPLTAAEVLNDWSQVADRAKAQRDDVQAATINDLGATLQASPELTEEQEENLVAYIALLPRDLCFGFVKTLLKIPEVALVLVKDRHDSVIFDAMQAITREAR